ncbi:hypothetical protein ACW9KT_21930 [Hymenobacter sp. HD11105]
MVLALYNKYRIKQLIKHISLCRGRELSESDFAHLLTKYTSFLSPLSFSPSREHYPTLYTNAAFASFAHQSKVIVRYLYAAIIVGYAALLVLA